jgi:O-antigen ligase
LLLTRRAADGPLPAGPLLAHSGSIATALVVIGLALAIVVGAHETSGSAQQLSGGASRLVSLRSNRYDYWHVALRAFALEPLHGVGAGNWQVYWLRWRTVQEFAADAHSLPLQTLAELGIVGVLALLAFLGGLLRAAWRAVSHPSAPAGAIAAMIAYLAHAPLDWDWEMPAVTLVALVLAGLVVALADEQATP